MKQPSLQLSSKFHSSSSWISLALSSVCIISTSSRNPIYSNLIRCLIASTLLFFPYSNGFHFQFEMSSHRSLPPRGGISLASSLVPQDQEYPDDHPSFPASSLSSSSTRRRKRTAKKGDIVTVQLHMELDPDYAIEPLFDLHGQHSFLLGYGNYLPDLHKLLLQQPEGSSLTNVSIDAGWGVVNSDLMATLPMEDVRQKFHGTEIQVGTSLYMKSGVSCVVTEMSEDSLMIDANHPLAGATYDTTVELLRVESAPSAFFPKEEEEQHETSSRYQVATFALGCFWGGELEFMRLYGVVGTKVGYTQGHVPHPTYDQVCDGNTGHTEAIMVLYDPDIITYEQLLLTATDRLGDDIYLMNQVGYDQGNQYRHGIYYHEEDQQNTAIRILKRFGEGVKTELKPAQEFYNAEDYHQQYLLKGGQSAKKNASEYIRCYG